MQEAAKLSHFSRASALDDMVSHLRLTPQTWDFVLTCFEPLTNVTGGIGTYTRLLLRLLSLEAGTGSVLFIASADLDDDLKPRLPGVTTIVAPPRDKRNDLYLMSLGDEHIRFSFAVAELLGDLERRGHVFRFIEFPDYGVEAYYTLKMRRHGQLNAGKIAVRLHSPHAMLFEDNEDPLYRLDVNARKVIAYEMFCYRHADAILYGADAMLERVQAICDRAGVDLGPRAVKIPHPMPARELISVREAAAPARAPVAPPAPAPPLPRGAKVITYVGRLENRKGVAHFFETLCRSEAAVELVRRETLVFQLAGRDLPHDETRSNADVVRAALARVGLSDRVVFLGNVPQDRLANEIAPRSDAFLFPSIFENYPNALLETLPLGKPTLVSARGGMPELAAPFPNVVAYDPLGPDAADRILAFLGDVAGGRFAPVGEAEARNRFERLAAASNREALARWLDLVARKPALRPAPEAPDPAVAFVVPHYNNAAFVEACLRSVIACAEPRDEIIVSDDASTSREFAALEAIVARLGASGGPRIRVLATTVNRGPSDARNRGVAAIATAAWIQFVDADDMLDPAGFRATRRAMRLNPDIDMAYGIQRSFGTLNHYWIPIDSNPSTVLDENFCHSAVLIKRAAFDRVGGFAAPMRYHFEDWEFNGRFCLAGLKGEMVVAETQQYRVAHKSRTTENRSRVLRSRQQLLSHIARARRVSGDPHLDWMAAALAGYASTLVRHDLTSMAVGQERRRQNINQMIGAIRHTIKSSPMPRWRKRLASLLLSATKRVGRVRETPGAW